jgi:hypothetical protein
MKITSYGITITTINGCIEVYTINVSFSYNLKLHKQLENSIFSNSYCIIIDKNNKEKLLINYGTGSLDEFKQACEQFEIISVNNKLDRILNKTSLSKTKMSQILISKVSFNV